MNVGAFKYNISVQIKSISESVDTFMFTIKDFTHK